METEIKAIDELCKKEIQDIKDKYNALIKEESLVIKDKFKKQKADIRKKYKKITPKRPTISKKLKCQVWDKYIGKDKGMGKCQCCLSTDIDSKHFEVGHVIAIANEGTTDIDNLLPICSCCNKSMGTTNLKEFQKQLISKESSKKDVDEFQRCSCYHNINVTKKICTVVPCQCMRCYLIIENLK